MLKIVSISDTHNRHQDITIPPCDLLIHCGDWTGMGKFSEILPFAKWLNEQTQCKNIVIVPGNHELHFEKQLPDSLNWIKDHAPNVHILIDQEIVIDGIKIYGSPATPFFMDWAWNRAINEGNSVFYFSGKMKMAPLIKPHWDAIPNDTNILITHGPPYGILDQTLHADGTPRPDHLGCPRLRERILDLKDLDLHFFGHIHAQGGCQKHEDGVSFYNSSICDEYYAPTNPLTIVEYEK